MKLHLFLSPILASLSLGQVIPTTGPPGLHPRYSINEYKISDADAYNMFLLGTRAFQNITEDSPSGYFGVSAIHGAPFESYNGVPSTNPQPYGYCVHLSVLFTTWHRAYMSHFEQELVKAAVSEAQKWPEGTERDRWVAAAQRVRQPYWDNSDPVYGAAFPSEYTVAEMEVELPTGTSTITNPLRQYTFDPANYNERVTEDFAGSIYRFENQTFKQPSGRISSQHATRRRNTYNLFSMISFSWFSSTGYPRGNDPATPADYNSVEFVHDGVHTDIGGFMLQVPVAAFDPVFWLHHAWVDRIVALYQAAHPQSIDGEKALVEPMNAARSTFGFPDVSNHVEDINTPLYPFLKTDGENWTSQDVSSMASIYELGYYYPELPASLQGQSDEAIRIHAIEQINALYAEVPAAAPAQRIAGALTRTVEASEWLATVQFDPAELDDSFLVEIISDDEKIGGVGSFSGTGMTMPSAISTGTVPLTDFLAERKIDGDDLEAVVEHLTKNLQWRVIDAEGKEVELSALPSLQVAVSASKVQYPLDSKKLPVFGEWSTFYQATEDKVGGAKIGEPEFASEDVADVSRDTKLAPI